MSDLCQPVPNGTFGRVAASFRLRNLREIHIHPTDVENRRLKPAATIIYKIKSLILGNNINSISQFHIILYYSNITIMKKIVHISMSFKEAEEWDTEQNLSFTPEEKLDILQRLRDEYYFLKNERRKGFQRVYRIIKQKQC